MRKDTSGPRESPEKLIQKARQTLEGAPEEIAAALEEMASWLVPFPAFLNMISVQAIELEPTKFSGKDHGCLVICPDGAIRRLELSTMSGVAGVLEIDAVEQFQEVDLSPEEYSAYAEQAMGLLYQEIERRGEQAGW